MVIYNRIASEGAVESIKTVSKDEKKISAVSKEIKVYSEDNLLKGKSVKIRDAFYEIKEEIYKLDSSIYEKHTKTMICFYSDGKGLIWLNPHKNSIRIHLRKGNYQDKYNKIKKNGWGGYPMLTLSEDEIDLSYLKDIFQQAFDN